MATLTELNPAEHGNLKRRDDCAGRFASTQHVLLIQAAEAARAVTSFPVFVSRSASTGRWHLFAITGLQVGKSLFVEDGDWGATFEPSCLQTYPFFLMQSDSAPEGFAVGFDAASGALSEDSGTALYSDQGKPSPLLTRVTNQLKADAQGDLQTRAFADCLDELGLFKSIKVNVHYASGAVQSITDLHTIDEDRLQSLDQTQLADLAGRGYLLLVHAMLLSVFQLNALIRRHNQHTDRPAVNQIKLEVTATGNG
ncbi:MAG: SapC family protein [Pseudomonadota bacterium]